MARKKVSRGAAAKPGADVRIYTLEVSFLRGGPSARADAKGGPAVSRTIQLRGDQTLADLHRATCEAFGRADEQQYEYQFPERPADPAGPRYVVPGAYDVSVADGTPAAGRVDRAALDSLGLEAGRRFTYWVDCGDDWWHQVEVRKVESRAPRGKYPKFTGRAGEYPPGPAGKEESGAGGPRPVAGSEAADAACLVGELHLSKGDYRKAVEAFTRAIEEGPTADAHEGRAKAYRALAAEDDRAARNLR